MQIAQLALFGLDVVFQLLPYSVALGQEHGQATADEVIGHEQLHFLADLAMVTLTGFLHLLFVLFQFLVAGKSHTVDTGEHLIAVIVLPIGAGLLGDLECLQALGVGEVRSDAHIDIFTLLEEAEFGFVCQVCHVLYLILFAALFHELYGLGTGQDKGLDGQVFLADLAHLFLDVFQIFVAQLGVAQIDIIVKALIGSGAKTKIGLREQALHGLCHNMGSGVAQYMQFLVFGALGNGAVLINDLHKCFLS